VISGSTALAVIALSCVWFVRRAEVRYPPSYSRVDAGSTEGTGPSVLLGYDGPHHRIAEAIRVDVRRGVAHSRADEAPIEDVARYVTGQIEKEGRKWVVITASSDEKFGDLLRVIDACRTTRARGIVLNYLPIGTQP
jgi:hypothetical protein